MSLSSKHSPLLDPFGLLTSAGTVPAAIAQTATAQMNTAMQMQAACVKQSIAMFWSVPMAMSGLPATAATLKPAAPAAKTPTAPEAVASEVAAPAQVTQRTTPLGPEGTPALFPKNTPLVSVSTPMAEITKAAANQAGVAKPTPKAKAAAPAPKAAAPTASVAKAEEVAPSSTKATRPKALKLARDGGADDLTAIKGIGPKLAAACHAQGIFHYDQIAAWTAQEAAWMDDNLEGFKGRVTRDAWVDQAKALLTLAAP